MTKDEALKLALEALEDLGMKHFENTGEVLYKDTFTAIKEALANEALEKKAENARELGLNYEPEPVGLVESLKDAKPCCGEYETCWRACTPRGKFLGQRDAQRTWVGLKDDDEIDWDGGDLKSFVKAIEAKLKEKNT